MMYQNRRNITKIFSNLLTAEKKTKNMCNCGNAFKIYILYKTDRQTPNEQDFRIYGDGLTESRN